MTAETLTSAMTPKQTAAAVSACIRARRPVFVWGPPGVGKSAIIREVADDHGLEVRDVRAVLLDPVDLRGLPHVNGDGRAHWAVPDFLPREGKGVLFLDELPAAPPLVQAACYQLILDRRLGEYELPDGWHVVAAGNREGDKAVSHRMPTPLANRFVHVNMVPDLDDWTQWAVNAGIAVEVIAFLRFRPELLYTFDPRSQERAFASPRSWEFASDLLGADLDTSIEFELLAGTVGEGAATELCGFLRVFRKLPSPDAVLLDPLNAAVPDEPATLYALTGALARKASDDNFDRVVQYADRLPPEFSVVLVRDSVHRTSSVQNTRAFIEWAAKNTAITI